MNTFKKLPIAAFVGAGLMALSGAALAGIAGTPHNLSSSATTEEAAGGPNDPVNFFSGTGEICVFCHTPHGSDTTASVPLWNRNLTAATLYTTYDSLGTSSLDGAVENVGSVSIACLSCHDGQQAMDTVINAPGSGLTGSTTWQSGTWEAGSNSKPQGVAMLGTDLTNDHPVGIQYAGGGYDSADTTAAGGLGDADFKAATHGTIGSGADIWWVDTESTPNGSREKTDMQLYTRTPSGGNAQPYVECASCHDPHVSDNPTFLRISNDGSAVCLACHTK